MKKTKAVDSEDEEPNRHFFSLRRTLRLRSRFLWRMQRDKVHLTRALFVPTGISSNTPERFFFEF